MRKADKNSQLAQIIILFFAQPHIFIYLCAKYKTQMSEILIGRTREREDLEEWLKSRRSEFIAVYGRRRVGKTFLVRKTVGNAFTFHFSGSYGIGRKEQLLNFCLALREQSGEPDIRVPENWVMAFHELKRLIEKSRNEQKIIFLDELPWMDSAKSGFIAALENFWNGWASWRDDIKLIVCGSATSWIIKNIIRNKGGLHNRITHSMLVKPFQLKECEEYFQVNGFHYTRKQIAECYMTMGGIPYYFSLMEKGKSIAQNIDYLFFNDGAPLSNEFDDLYRSLYKNYQSHIKIIKALAEKGIGLTRKEIVGRTGLTNNGEFSKMLEELELCGFIRGYLPFRNKYNTRATTQKTNTDTLYQLIDFYSLFYLKFHHQQQLDNTNFWSGSVNSPKVNAWRGLTFEMLCLCHVDRIKSALGIGDVSTHTCSWRGEYSGRGAQIDMLIDRQDDTINLCEIKYSSREYTIDKATAERLEEKIEVFTLATHTRKNILLTLITTEGVARNTYSHIVQREVTLDQLF